jgi:aspartyl-tRNA(Asn)/glutamyl-tRNA(Gln) amidotransferase subunit C
MENTKISKEDVRYVARLARLNVSDEEMETFAVQLNSILSYIDKLNELDTSDIEPMSHVIDVCNAFREDIVERSFSQEVALENAPQREDGFFTVPRIIGT